MRADCQGILVEAYELREIIDQCHFERQIRDAVSLAENAPCLIVELQIAPRREVDHVFPALARVLRNSGTYRARLLT